MTEQNSIEAHLLYILSVQRKELALVKFTVMEKIDEDMPIPRDITIRSSPKWCHVEEYCFPDFVPEGSTPIYYDDTVPERIAEELKETSELEIFTFERCEFMCGDETLVLMKRVK